MCVLSNDPGQFTLNSNPLNFTDAITECESQGGGLVKLDSRGKTLFMLDTLDLPK